jgi:integrase
MTEITYWSRALPGFGLRVRASGARSWIAMARLKGLSRTIKRTFGDAGTVKFAEATETARDWLSAIRRGVDPGEAARQRRQAVRMDALIGMYLDHQGRAVKPATHKEVRRYLLVNAKPLHRKLSVDVSRRDVVELLQKVAERAPIQANRTRSSLSALFAWGMKAGLVPANPVAATFTPSEERPRDRVLSDDELAWAWAATENTTGDYRRIVRLLMLTGARRSEIAGMCEDELVRHEGGAVTWTLPAQRAKNGLPNELVLPPWIAANIPPPRLDSGAGRDLLFGRYSPRGFTGWKQGKAQLDATLKRSGHAMPEWRLHDLRRTFVTKLNDLGVEPHVIEALVNHASGNAKGGIAGVYNRSSYRDQKQAALALWADHARSLVGPSGRDQANVVALRRAG